MKVPQSQVDFYVDLYEKLLLSCCESQDPFLSKHLLLDIRTLRARTQNEGLSFLSRTLPLLGKAFDQGLMTAKFSCPREFKRSYVNNSVPAFLQTHFNLVFNDNGSLRSNIDPHNVYVIRQILFFAYKLEIPYTRVQEQSVLDTFVSNEEFLAELVIEEDAVLSMASTVTASVFSDFDPKDITPRHGPGAVSTGERGDSKWNFTRLYDGIHQCYPYYKYFIVGGARELVDRIDWYKGLNRIKTGTAKVILVPKDSRGPRLISAEPLEYMWLQQGLGRKIVKHLESFNMTRGQVNFSDQTINQRIAERSSIDENFATLDLKDASDLVSVQLVEKIFGKTPELLRHLLALRTTETRLPDGRLVTLRKFAPMGSALCFPIEAFTFYVLLVSAIKLASRMPMRDVMKLVYVYGDDIIVPKEYANLSIQTLETYGLKVNKQKCCLNNNFRESCGFDAFMGEKVTPLRLKKLFSGSRRDGAAFASYISLINEFRKRNMEPLVNFLIARVERVFGKIPLSLPHANYQGIEDSDPLNVEVNNTLHHRWRWSQQYQRKEYFVLVSSQLKSTSQLDGWARLLRNQSYGRIDDPSHVVFPRSTIIKRRWCGVS